MAGFNVEPQAKPAKVLVSIELRGIGGSVEMELTTHEARSIAQDLIEAAEVVHPTRMGKRP